MGIAIFRTKCSSKYIVTLDFLLSPSGEKSAPQKKNTRHYISLIITKFPIPFVHAQGEQNTKGNIRTNTPALHLHITIYLE